MRPVLVLMLGVPGAGKSTLGQALADALHAAYVSLDEIKEARYAAGLDRDDRFAMRLACEVMLAERCAAAPGPAVADLWVQPGRDDARACAWLNGQDRPVRQLICRVPADVALSRYRNRPRGGPHLRPDAETEERIRAAVTAIGPLGDWPWRDVDTSGAVDLADVALFCRTG